ncbi:heparin lyase I family protein [Mycolicibacterium confluentis]|uniref:Twin-arginine translocation signal domain-containing protein n=1 Tax=Mycolicibacterium confluentis TaxID=28047 RepID=A0A7I7XZU7_9MYCO|nr:heparin lyase I family protein [Mycolicibacterium confluentis]MCV7319875.1 heparin lyase I family protein [Mycolicibacterium confluentis]BBZ34905.1 hypothetical protein MCNF_35100 [Mycolicibacterium confluentis]
MTDRRRFLRHAAVGAAALAGGSVLLPKNGVSHAEPSGVTMLVGPQDEAVNVRSLVCGSSAGVCPTPALLNDGRYALPVAVLRDPAYAVVSDVLTTWKLEAVARDDYVRADGAFLLGVDGKVMRQAGRPASLTLPNSDVFRFEVRADDFAGPYDSESGSRRSEIVARQRDGIGEETVWSSFCLVLGDTPGLADAGRGIVHQWHSVDRDIGRTPVLFMDVSHSRLTIRTCSSSRLYGQKARESQSSENGRSVTHFSGDVPAEGEKTYVTLQATFGEDGHLNAWINGEHVVEIDTPIGYYDDLADGSGRTVLGYPHWGLYTTNRPDTDVVYIANPEWGTDSLRARIEAPRSVPDVT